MTFTETCISNLYEIKSEKFTVKYVAYLSDTVFRQLLTIFLWACFLHPTRCASYLGRLYSDTLFIFCVVMAFYMNFICTCSTVFRVETVEWLLPTDMQIDSETWIFILTDDGSDVYSLSWDCKGHEVIFLFLWGILLLFDFHLTTSVTVLQAIVFNTSLFVFGCLLCWFHALKMNNKIMKLCKVFHRSRLWKLIFFFNFNWKDQRINVSVSKISKAFKYKIKFCAGLEVNLCRCQCLRDKLQVRGWREIPMKLLKLFNLR